MNTRRLSPARLIPPPTWEQLRGSNDRRVSAAARDPRIGRPEGSGSVSRRFATRVAGLPLSVTLLLGALLLVSCQQVFTFSPLKSLQQNPANMSAAQQVAYAEQALQSGDASTMKTAYDAIKGSTDPQTQVLAGELAFGASGATAALTQALADIASGASTSSVQTVLNSVDISLATAGAQNIVNASAGGATVTDNQYAIASAAYVVAAAQLAGGFNNLAGLTSGPAYNDLQEAKTLVGNIQSATLSSAVQSLY